MASGDLLRAACTLAVFCLSATAFAQEAFDIDRYRPASLGDPFFAVGDATTGGGTLPRLGITMDHAHDPVIVRAVEGGGYRGEVVEKRLRLLLRASTSVHERVRIDLGVPLIVLDELGDAASSVGVSHEGPALGDVDLSARARLAGPDDGPGRIALQGRVWVPTGSTEALSSDGTMRFEPSVMLGGSPARALWGLQGGVLLRPERVLSTTTSRTEATFGAAVALRSEDDSMQIGPEIHGSVVLTGPSASTERTRSVEALLGAKLHESAWTYGLAVGPGLTSGIGTPTVRILASIVFDDVDSPDSDGDGFIDSEDQCVHVPGVASTDPSLVGCPDRDHDGITDALDACPKEAGPRREDKATTGCPDRDHDGIPDRKDACPDDFGPEELGCPDRDGDGIFDRDDACPDIPGVHHLDSKRNGCPQDRDGDGVLDSSDACPDVPGPRNGDAARNGCPTDADADGIPDNDDACPQRPGPASQEPRRNGCPTLVRLTNDKIEILERVHFETASAKILSESDELLEQVASVLRDHPELLRVRVEGHTDDRGDWLFNMKLSQQRAEAVRDWLVDRGGVNGSRLAALGFGMARPIAPNADAKGRQKNRRVEFNILERSKEGGR